MNARSLAAAVFVGSVGGMIVVGTVVWLVCWMVP